MVEEGRILIYAKLRVRDSSRGSSGTIVAAFFHAFSASAFLPPCNRKKDALIYNVWGTPP
jgi:hypothetical protein